MYPSYLYYWPSCWRRARGHLWFPCL